MITYKAKDGVFLMKFSTILYLCLVMAFLVIVPGAAVNGIGGGTGYFEITSSPSGAFVYFDDSYKGTTPVTVSVSTTGSPDHTIRVEKDGYQTWQDSYYGNPFEGETIHIFAELTYIPPTTPIGGGKGYYSISSSPSGASVHFDGSYKGTTPVTVSVPSTGTPGHTISVSLSGYQTWTRSYSGNPGEGETIYVSASLEPIQEYGSINVDSSPTQATATLDGSNSKTTPCTFYNVYPGSHTVRLTKSGYESWSTSVSVSAGRTSQVYATLSRISPSTGSIYAVTTPQGASFYVDGKYYGITPQIASGLAVGYHQVRLSLSGFQDWSGSIYVEDGKTTTITQTLSVSPTTHPTPEPGKGSISVSSNPSGAEVYIDNVYHGLTPVTITSVDPGSRVVKLQLAGYTPWQATVQVNSGQSTPVEATLQPQPTSAPTKAGLGMPLILLSLGLLALTRVRREK